MNSRLVQNLLGFCFGVLTAILFVVHPLLALAVLVAAGLAYLYNSQLLWSKLSRTKNDFVQADLKEVDPIHAYYKRARARLAEKDYDGAIGDFNRVIELDDRRAAAYFYRAEALLAIPSGVEALPEDLEEVIADLQIALDLMRKNPVDPLYGEIERTLKTTQQSLGLIQASQLKSTAELTG